MSVDRSYRVRIETSADLKGFKSYERHIKDLNKYEKRHLDQTQKQNKALRSQKGAMQGLRDSIRSTALAFPVLGRLGEAALNPIGLAIASLIGAFALLREKILDAGTAFKQHSGFGDSARLSATAEKWKTLAQYIGEAAEGINTISQKGETALSGIRENLDVLDRLGKGSALTTKLSGMAEADQMRKTAAGLIQSARRKRSKAKSMTIGSADKDAKIQEKLAADATQAEKDIEENMEMVRAIDTLLTEQDVFSGKSWRFAATKGIPAFFKYVTKYGTTNMRKVREQLEIENRSHREIIGRRDTHRESMAARVHQREAASALEASAGRDEDAAAGYLRSASSTAHKAQLDYVIRSLQNGTPVTPSASGGGLTSRVGEVNQVRLIMEKQSRLDQLLLQLSRSLDQRIAATATQLHTRPD